MKKLYTKLADYFEVDGWELVQKYTQDLEWWADEIWELKSRWSPHGLNVFVTFLVDPMWDGHRRKGQGVWAVGCTGSFPRDRGEAQLGGILSEGSKQAIEEFVELVNGFRKVA